MFFLPNISLTEIGLHKKPKILAMSLRGLTTNGGREKTDI